MSGKNSLGLFVLDAEGNPVPEPDASVWARWMADADRHVGNDMVGEVQVSTVFLGLDHNHARFFGGPTEPVLWETMVFGGQFDETQERYTSCEAAKAGHRRWLNQVTVLAEIAPAAEEMFRLLKAMRPAEE